MKYDIFISYRREDSSGRSNVPTARQFKLAFEAPPYNYKVFFDYSECTDNYFSDTILPAIRTCDFFVLVLTKDCLLRCSNEGDWVRREIEEAIAYNRKIIPITPDKECESIPLGLPASLRKLDGLQITTVYTDHMFEACVEFLVKNRFHIDSEAERKAKEEAERTRLEKERIAKAEAERKERETAERERDERKRKAEEARRKAEQERIDSVNLDFIDHSKESNQLIKRGRLFKTLRDKFGVESNRNERLEAERKTKKDAQSLNDRGTANGHEWVDLGLPNGTLWATSNVGASKPEDYGDYFAWGEINTKNAYNWDSYKYANGDYDKLTKYCNDRLYGNNGFTDKLTELQAGDDPATVNWGNGWQTPNLNQWDELLSNTTNQRTTRNGVKGWIFTSKKNGLAIFLPAAGYRQDVGLSRAGSDGEYWSRSLDTGIPNWAWYLIVFSGGCYMGNRYRNIGRPVRPVRSVCQN